MEIIIRFEILILNEIQFKLKLDRSNSRLCKFIVYNLYIIIWDRFSKTNILEIIRWNIQEVLCILLPLFIFEYIYSISNMYINIYIYNPLIYLMIY